MMAPNKQTGFTLVELMIVIVVVAILAAIALPSYQNSVLKTRRSDAKAALSQLAQNLERCFTQYGAYNHANCPSANSDSDEGYYTLSIVSTASTYTVTATPKNPGPQSGDAECTTLTLTQTGLEGATGSNSGVCW